MPVESKMNIDSIDIFISNFPISSGNPETHLNEILG